MYIIHLPLGWNPMTPKLLTVLLDKYEFITVFSISNVTFFDSCKSVSKDIRIAKWLLPNAINVNISLLGLLKLLLDSTAMDVICM